MATPDPCCLTPLRYRDEDGVSCLACGWRPNTPEHISEAVTRVLAEIQAGTIRNPLTPAEMRLLPELCMDGHPLVYRRKDGTQGCYECHRLRQRERRRLAVPS